jgi:hypothetical protein
VARKRRGVRNEVVWFQVMDAGDFGLRRITQMLRHDEGVTLYQGDLLL